MAGSCRLTPSSKSDLRLPGTVADGEALDAGGEGGEDESHFWPSWQAAGPN